MYISKDLIQRMMVFQKVISVIIQANKIQLISVTEWKVNLFKEMDWKKEQQYYKIN